MRSIIGALLCLVRLHKWGPWGFCPMCNPGKPRHIVLHRKCLRCSADQSVTS